MPPSQSCRNLRFSASGLSVFGAGVIFQLLVLAIFGEFLENSCHACHQANPAGICGFQLLVVAYFGAGAIFQLLVLAIIGEFLEDLFWYCFANDEAPESGQTHRQQNKVCRQCLYHAALGSTI
jgi:hypothetical protein